MMIIPTHSVKDWSEPIIKVNEYKNKDKLLWTYLGNLIGFGIFKLCSGKLVWSCYV